MHQPARIGKEPPARPASSPLSLQRWNRLGGVAGAQALGATGPDVGRGRKHKGCRVSGYSGGVGEPRGEDRNLERGSGESLRASARSSSRPQLPQVRCSRTRVLTLASHSGVGVAGSGVEHSLSAWLTVSTVPRLLPEGQSELPTLCSLPPPHFGREPKSTNKQTGSET